MRVVCTQCKEFHEIRQMSEARCPVCRALMSIFEKDIIEVSLDKKFKINSVNKIEKEGFGL